MKKICKIIINLCSIVLVAPFWILSLLESKFTPSSEVLYVFGAHCMACLPGLPGAYLRRAYYHLAAEHCSLTSTIGFGSLLVHRNVIIDERTAIGNYALIGSVRIGKGCEIGSRVSIPSGKQQHTKNPDGTWSAFEKNKVREVAIADNVWIGEGAIVMANVGTGSLIAAGAVVVREIPSGVVSAGNPADVLKSL